ncbi:MAG: YitT family protein [Desulfobacterales bacterium]|nr:YitT family protein [Desulfobacterales bacterium]
MKWKSIRQQSIEYSMTIGAGILYSIALKYFVLPSKVILTGTEGIAAALSYYFDSYGLFILLYVVFQVLLLVFAFVKVSNMFATRSLIVVATVVLFLAFLPDLRFAEPEPQNERVILVLFGGLLSGVAKAIAFRYRGSTGDEDLIGAYFAMKYLKPVGSIAVLSAIGSTTFGLIMDFMKTGDFETAVNTLMYTCIYIFISTQTLNNLYSKFKIKMVAIITSDYEIVGKTITETFEYRTYTVQEGLGGHSGESFWMVRTIITAEELPQLIDAIEIAEPGCFYFHHDIEGVSRKYYITPIG